MVWYQWHRKTMECGHSRNSEIPILCSQAYSTESDNLWVGPGSQNQKPELWFEPCRVPVKCSFALRWPCGDRHSTLNLKSGYDDPHSICIKRSMYRWLNSIFSSAIAYSILVLVAGFSVVVRELLTIWVVIHQFKLKLEFSRAYPSHEASLFELAPAYHYQST
jgi:hypothetical protein